MKCKIRVEYFIFLFVPHLAQHDLDGLMKREHVRSKTQVGYQCSMLFLCTYIHCLVRFGRGFYSAFRVTRQGDMHVLILT
jgi:hypothetical protein